MSRWLLLSALLFPAACAPTVVEGPSDDGSAAQAGTGPTSHHGGASDTDDVLQGEGGTAGGNADSNDGRSGDKTDTPVVGENDCPVVGYVRQGDECVWSNPIVSPTFSSREGWITNGSAQVDTAGGWGVFSHDALCFGGSISQEVVMPAASDVAPMALTFRARRAGGSFYLASLGVVVNGGLHAVDVAYDNRWVDNTICLGEGDYGGPVTVEFERYASPISCDVGPIHIDNVAIEPAESGQCPTPGVVADGDFDMDPPRWTGTEGASFTGTSAVLLGSPCNDLSIEGTVSVPLSSSASHPALAVTYSTKGLTGDSIVTVNLEGLRVGALLSRATSGTTNVCVPNWARGGAHALSVSMADPFGGSCISEAEATIESITLVEDASCTELEPIDGGFEGVQQASGRAWSYGLGQDGIIPSVSETPLAAHSGSAAFMLDVRNPCAEIGATTVMASPMPKTSGAKLGPALSYWYRLPINERATFTICAGAACSERLEGSSTWRQGKVCIDPTLGGMPLEVTLTGKGGDGSCQTPYDPEIAWFDDLELTTDADCPVD